jgi:hypothetical protein
MNRLQKFCLLGVFSLETMSFHEAAQAQITPYLGKPHQIRPDLYRKQNDGTILETKTGDIYDMKGNLLKPATRFRSPNASSTSQLTPEQIRELAKALKTTSSISGQTTQESFCKMENGGININGRPLSSGEMATLRNELGC